HIRSVVENPTYHYSPKLKFKGVKTQKPFDIAAGPLNPVGSTWIVHGTPSPQSVGKSGGVSHGCVHLTNWDARALAKLVHRGTQGRVHQLRGRWNGQTAAGVACRRNPDLVSLSPGYAPASVSRRTHLPFALRLPT